MADAVSVARAELRSIRASVVVIIVGIAMMVTAFGIKLFSDVDRCRAGNEFRSQDLPAAFRVHDEHLGAAFEQDEATVDAFSDDFEADLAEILPERDCTLLGL